MVASAIYEDWDEAHVRAFAHGNRVTVNFPTDLGLEYTVGPIDDLLAMPGEIDASHDRALAAIVVMLTSTIERSLYKRLGDLGIMVKHRGNDIELEWSDEDGGHQMALAIVARPLN